MNKLNKELFVTKIISDYIAISTHYYVHYHASLPNLTSIYSTFPYSATVLSEQC